MNSRDDKSSNAQETNSSFASSAAGNHCCQLLQFAIENGETKSQILARALDGDPSKLYFAKGKIYRQLADFNSAAASTSAKDGDEEKDDVSSRPLTATKSIEELAPSSGPRVSPPHYED